MIPAETQKVLHGIALQVMQYAESQIAFAKKADSVYLTNIRLSRAKGALESIRSFADQTLKFQELQQAIDDNWARAEDDSQSEWDRYDDDDRRDEVPWEEH